MKSAVGLNHLAIIMDGNRRWAHDHGLSAMDGHTKGYEVFHDCVRYLVQENIPEVSFFAMSSENFLRAEPEVQHMMHLFLLAAQDGLALMQEKKVAVRIVGDVTRLNAAVRTSIDLLHARTVPDAQMRLNICFSYGGQWHIQSAFEKAMRMQGNTEDFLRFVTEPFIHPIDFVIRTGGDYRISNFALWQLAYAELMFIEPFWPDFNRELLHKCLADFNKRQRRFGGSE